MLQDLSSAVTSVIEDRNVHVIVLEAEGGLPSGHDLKEVTGDNQNHGTYGFISTLQQSNDTSTLSLKNL